jgi:hypothetical protein
LAGFRASPRTVLERVTHRRQEARPDRPTRPLRQRDRRTGSRGIDWFVHVAVDYATRLAYVEVLADEKATIAAGFLGRPIAFIRGLGVRVERVMTSLSHQPPLMRLDAQKERPGWVFI